MDLFFPMLALGLVTSVHCVSMCGPMVVTYALKGAENGTVVERLTPNLAYQGAKIASYMFVGLVLGAVGSLFDLSGVRPYVMAAAGVFMIILGLGMTGRVPWAAKLAPRPPRLLIEAFSRARNRARTDAEDDRATLATPITFGLLTGLMPCAPLVAAQLNAAASGSALSGALAMLAFGLGTAPLMLGFGTGASLLPARFKQRATVVLALVVLVFGATYLNRGAMLLGSPITAQAIVAAVTGPAAANEAGYTIAEDGVAEVPLVIENVRFSPGTLDIPAETPVRLIVERRESNPCSDQLWIPQLGVLADLAPNATTVVPLPPAAAGAYTLTCGMGMMSGQLRVGAATGSAALLPAASAGPRSGPACACCANKGSGERIEGAAVQDGDVQRITVRTANGYDPNVIRLASGMPAEITFEAASGCLAQVMSEDLGFFADLTTGDRTVTLPALEPGEYGFSCGMRMVFGTIVVE